LGCSASWRGYSSFAGKETSLLKRYVYMWLRNYKFELVAFGDSAVCCDVICPHTSKNTCYRKWRVNSNINSQIRHKFSSNWFHSRQQGDTMNTYKCVLYPHTTNVVHILYDTSWNNTEYGKLVPSWYVRRTVGSTL
jgi:hypothetical protein